MRMLLCATGAALIATSLHAAPVEPPRFRSTIERLSQEHDVPVSLIHRIIMRESRYEPRAQHGGHYGLMQIKPATARGMGFNGAPAALLDGDTNLTYGVPYLANAWRLSGGSETRAVQLYAGGYYYVAKKQKMLGSMRTAKSDAVKAKEPEVAYAPEPPPNPFRSLFRALSGE